MKAAFSDDVIESLKESGRISSNICSEFAESLKDLKIVDTKNLMKPIAEGLKLPKFNTEVMGGI